MVCAALLGIWLVLYEVDEARWEQGGISAYWFVLWLTIAAAAYVVAIVATARRATHRFGVGMLFGLTAVFLVGLAVLALQVAFTPS